MEFLWHQLPIMFNLMLSSKGTAKTTARPIDFDSALLWKFGNLDWILGINFCTPMNRMLPTEFSLHTPDKGENVSIARADQPNIIFDNYLDPEKDVVIIVHEYLRGCDKPFTQNTTRAYLKMRDVQVVTVCWKAAFPKLERWVGKGLGVFGYGLSTQLVPCVADLIALFLKRLHRELRVPWRRMSIVTHSLGCQLAGDAGNKVGGKLGKIIALDPAVPFYVPRPLYSSLLNETSAQNVIVLHTSIGQLNMGTADFYANSLLKQPGCEYWLSRILVDSLAFLNFLLCNHSRSFELFLESVLNPTAFSAEKCDNFIHYELGLCQMNEKAFFGPDTNAKGTFYFMTTDKPPYY